MGVDRASYVGGVTRKNFKPKPLWLRPALVLAAILLPIVLVWVAPCLGIREGGKISLSSMQLLYGLVSAEIAAAVYMWGVGNWSRVEPPRPSFDTLTHQPNGQAPAHVPPQPVQVNVALPANLTVAPPAPPTVAPA